MARKGGIGGAKVLWRGFCRAKLSRREEPCRRRRARGADGREGRKRISYSHLPIHFSSINVLSSPFNSASCPGLAKSRRIAKRRKGRLAPPRFCQRVRLGHSAPRDRGDWARRRCDQLGLRLDSDLTATFRDRSHPAATSESRDICFFIGTKSCLKRNTSCGPIQCAT